MTALPGPLTYLSESLQLNYDIGYVSASSLRSYCSGSIFLLVLDLLKSPLDIFGVKQPVSSLSSLDIPCGVLYVLSPPTCRLIKVFFYVMESSTKIHILICDVSNLAILDHQFGFR